MADLKYLKVKPSKEKENKKERERGRKKERTESHSNHSTNYASSSPPTHKSQKAYPGTKFYFNARIITLVALRNNCPASLVDVSCVREVIPTLYPNFMTEPHDKQLDLIESQVEIQNGAIAYPS
ncbi:hypothetical protein WUBG_03922 [Wuchereria bancrofti]|uniref:Uncharacterized protein n=1 Tax=Wuchereria bancrofti TaxID=6293 RepID=J9ESK8_WUCBA|nr:hypothetical protein WUBG_03922 [Wuchereria bancrofti]